MDRGIYQIGRSLGVQKNYFIEYETYEQYVVKIAIPGENEVDNINVVMSNGTLKIRYPGNTFTEPFYYYFRIHKPIVADQTLAVLEDGLLTVKMIKNLDN